jgi:hypothetical protein
VIAGSACEECGLLHSDLHRCKVPGLVAAFKQRGVKVTDEDERMLRWMAKWDRSTCDWFVSVVTRAEEAGAKRGSS